MPCRSASGASASCVANDLAHARQKHEHVPRRLAQRLRHGRGDQFDHRPLLAAALIADRHRKPPPLGVNDRALPSSFATGSAASVALITTIRSSGRSVWRMRTNSPSARSISIVRS